MMSRGFKKTGDNSLPRYLNYRHSLMTETDGLSLPLEGFSGQVCAEKTQI